MSRKSSADIRKINRRKEIINWINQRGKLSKNDLTSITGYSISTVIAAVDELAEEGIIYPTETSQAGVGRPAIYYSLNPEYGYSIGIDFNSESIHISIINLKRETVYSISEKMERSQNAIADILPKMQNLLDKLLNSIPGKKAILCIGIASPGPYDAHARRMLYYTQNVDIVTPFAERYHCPCYVSNNLSCLAMAYKEKAQKPINNMILMGIRAGVGMSCILNGTIFRGNGGQAGWIGHTRLPGSTALCKCGKIGCLDAELSMHAITSKMEKRLGAAVDENGNPVSVSEKMALFIERVQKKQPDCLQILDESCYYLAMSVTQVIHLFNPSDIFFYGELTQCGEFFLDNLKKYLDAHFFEENPQKVSLSLTALSDYAFAEGAAYYAFDRYFAPEE